MITKTEFIAAIGRVHANTYTVVALLRDDHVAWRPRDGEFSVGELTLHIANTRLMNVQIVRGETAHYSGHRMAPGETADHLRQTSLRSGKKTIAQLHDADLEAPIRNLHGVELPAWRIAMNGLVEHEIHHRSQLSSYLAELGIEPPALFGIHVLALPR